MDRFKFRVWDKTLNKYKDDCVICTDGVLYEEVNHYDISNRELDVDEYIIEQSTGLKDKNGVLIYEGDSVRVYNNEEVDYPKYEDFKVGYHNMQFELDNKFTGTYLCELEDYTDDLEVIGNIHENKELLEG